jgi:hypothetical protein
MYQSMAAAAARSAGYQNGLLSAATETAARNAAIYQSDSFRRQLKAISQPVSPGFIEAINRLNSDSLGAVSPATRASYESFSRNAKSSLQGVVAPVALEIYRNLNTAHTMVPADQALSESLDRVLDKYDADASSSLTVGEFASALDDLSELGILKDLGVPDEIELPDSEKIPLSEAIRELVGTPHVTREATIKTLGPIGGLTTIIHPLLQESMPESSYPGELWFIALGLAISLWFLWYLTVPSSDEEAPPE